MFGRRTSVNAFLSNSAHRTTNEWQNNRQTQR